MNDFCKKLSSEMFTKYSIIISSKWHRTSLSHAMNLSFDEIDFYLNHILKPKNLIKEWENKNEKINMKRAYF